MGLVSKTAKLNKQELDLLSFLVERTGTLAKDIILDSETNRIIFIVPSGNAGKIIGQKGETISGLKKDLHKDIDVVEYSPDIEKFLGNLLRPVKISEINLRRHKSTDKVTVEIYIAQKDIGRVIGKQGQNLKRTKLILDRQFDGIENIKIFPELTSKANQEKNNSEE